MSDVRHLQKDDNVSFKNTNYKALSEEKVTTIMRKKMIDYKLVVFPVKQECRRDGYITHVDVTYKIVDAETGDSIEVVSCGDGADTQDKGAGKAMTYAYKYMWLRTFALPTGEDPDKIASAQLDEEQANVETPDAKAPKKKVDAPPTTYHRKNDPITKEQLSAIGALQDTPERVDYYRKALDYWNVTPEQLTYSQGIEVIKKLRALK